MPDLPDLQFPADSVAAPADPLFVCSRAGAA